MCTQRRTALSPFSLLLAAVTTMFVFAASLAAQVDRASLGGAVTDPSGSVVPGARIELLSPATDLRRETVTNAVGIYSFSLMKSGWAT